MKKTTSGNVKKTDYIGLRPRFDFNASVPNFNDLIDFNTSRSWVGETIDEDDAAPHVKAVALVDGSHIDLICNDGNIITIHNYLNLTQI